MGETCSPALWALLCWSCFKVEHLACEWSRVNSLSCVKDAELLTDDFHVDTARLGSLPTAIILIKGRDLKEDMNFIQIYGTDFWLTEILQATETQNRPSPGEDYTRP